MVEERVAVELPLPPEVVFAFAADPRNEPRWRQGVKAVGPPDREPRVATSYSRRVGKRDTAFDITEWDPPRRVAFDERTTDSVRVRFELEAAGEGTRLVYTQRRLSMVAPRVVGGPARWSLSATMKGEVERLAEGVGVEPAAIDRLDPPHRAGPPFEEVIDVAAPPEAVFALLADPRTEPRWRFDLEVRVEADFDAPAVGARFHKSGEVAAATWEIGELEPPRRAAFRSLDGPHAESVAFDLEPIAVGTRIHYIHDLRANKGWLQSLVRAGGLAAHHLMAGDLRRISRELREG